MIRRIIRLTMITERESRKSLNQVNHGSDHVLLDNLKGSLPSIEAIEREMSRNEGVGDE
jgi:hypothetical protein